jgi:hypothetical protein
MKLSEAMLLGSTLVKMEACELSSCAYGAALRAVGILPHRLTYVTVAERWPWTAADMDSPLTSGMLNEAGCSVYEKFDFDVCTGRMTFEQLVDYVRSIEPECGRCNSFQCVCEVVDEKGTVQETTPESVVL